MRYLTGNALSQFDLEEAVAWEQLRGFGADEQPYRWTSEQEDIVRQPTPIKQPVKWTPPTTLTKVKPTVFAQPEAPSPGQWTFQLPIAKPLATKAPTPVRALPEQPTYEALMAAAAQRGQAIRERALAAKAAQTVALPKAEVVERAEVVSLPEPVVFKPPVTPVNLPPLIAYDQPTQVVTPVAVAASPELDPLRQQLASQVQALQQEVAVAAHTGESVPATERNIRILENKIRSIDERSRMPGVGAIQKIKETLSSMAQDGLVHSVDTLYGLTSLAEDVRLAGMAKTAISDEDQKYWNVMVSNQDIAGVASAKVRNTLLSGVNPSIDAPAVQADKIWNNLRGMQIGSAKQQEIASIAAVRGEAAIPVDKFEDYSAWKIGGDMRAAYGPQLETLGMDIYKAVTNVTSPGVDKQSALEDLYAGVERMSNAVGQNSKTLMRQLFITNPVFRGKNVAHIQRKFGAAVEAKAKEKEGIGGSIARGLIAIRDFKPW